jgi:phage-related protein
MEQARGWTVVFYVDQAGRESVREFLESLDLKTQARFDWSIEQLRVRNIQAREPLVKHLEGKIWELRRESNTNIYRLLYSLLPNRRILILHGFQQEEAAKSALWLQLVEARQRAGLSQAEVANRMGVSQAQVARIEKAGYDAYTLNTLRRYVAALGDEFSLEVQIHQPTP